MNFEWLPAPLPQDLALSTPGSIGVASNTVKVYRTPNLELAIEADADGDGKQEEAAVPGTRSTGATLQLVRGEITGYKIIHHKTETKGERKHSFIKGEADAFSLLYNPDAQAECSTITEWLANVPRRIWERRTDRQKIITTRRQRDDAGIENQSKSEMFGADYIQIELGLPNLESVLIGTVPPEFVTEGLKIEGPGFVEYRRGPSGLPDESLRRTVIRAIEFLFGSGLGVLGRSEFASGDRLIRAEYTSTYIPGGVGAGHRPALLHPENWQDGLSGATIAPILRRFIELEPSYDLNKAVWLYLHGRNSPLEMAAGYVGAAFEILRRGFYEQPENEARSRLMPKDRWQLVGKEVRRLFADLAQRETLSEYSDEIQEVERRLAELNKVSGTKLSRLFLSDLHLQYGDVEIKALQARNEAAHAMRFNTSEGFEKLWAYRALQTLFGRVLLRLLAAQVHYFDYSTVGHPLRALETQQGAMGT